MNDDTENPGECECCGFETDALEDYGYQARDPNAQAFGRKKAHHWCCQFCAGTLTSNYNEYPGISPDLDVMKTICYVGNVLLAAIKESR